MKNKRLIFSLIILFFAAVTHIVGIFLPPNAFYGIIRPAVYVLLSVVAFIFIGLDFGYFKAKKTATTILLFGTLIYAALLFVSALIAGLGHNPMAANWGAVTLNIWQYIPFALLGEILRFQLMKNASLKHKGLMLFLVTVIFSFCMLDGLGGIFGASTARQLEFLMTQTLPVFVLNFFLTYICQSGALAGTVCFRAAYSLVLVFLPVLPAITPIFLAIITYTAIIVMFFLYDKYAFDRKQKAETVRKRYKWRAYILPAVVLVLCIIFASGVLPTGPVAVASESMTGEFNKGDLVIVRKLNAEEAVGTLEVGDIIQFVREDKVAVIHRIVEIKTDSKGETQYVTKGDHNDEADESPVSPGQIIGVARFKIPFLGYPTVLLMELITNDK